MQRAAGVSGQPVRRQRRIVEEIGERAVWIRTLFDAARREGAETFVGGDGA